MAIQKGHRFPIELADAFPQGLVLMGVLAPDSEYQSREDRAAGRPVRQYHSYVFRATGFRAAGTAGKSQTSGKPSGSESTSKAA